MVQDLEFGVSHPWMKSQFCDFQGKWTWGNFPTSFTTHHTIWKRPHLTQSLVLTQQDCLWKYFHIPSTSPQFFRILVCLMTDQSIIVFRKFRGFQFGVIKVLLDCNSCLHQQPRYKVQGSQQGLSTLRDTSQATLVQDPSRMWKRGEKDTKSEEGARKSLLSGKWKLEGFIAADFSSRFSTCSVTQPSQFE